MVCVVCCQVEWHVIMQYLRSGGLTAFIMSLLLFFVYIALQVLANIWLTAWTTDAEEAVNGTMDTNKVHFRLGVYGMFGVAQGIYIIKGTFGTAYSKICRPVGLQKWPFAKIFIPPERSCL